LTLNSHFYSTIINVINVKIIVTLLQKNAAETLCSILAASCDRVFLTVISFDAETDGPAAGDDDEGVVCDATASCSPTSSDHDVSDLLLSSSGVIPDCSVQRTVQRTTEQGCRTASDIDRHRQTLNARTDDMSHVDLSTATNQRHQQLTTLTSLRAAGQASCHSRQHETLIKTEASELETTTASSTCQSRRETDMSTFQSRHDTDVSTCPSRHETDMSDIDLTDLFDLILPQSSLTSSSSSSSSSTRVVWPAHSLSTDEHDVAVAKSSSHKFLSRDDELFDLDDDMSSSPEVGYSIQFALETIKSHS